MGGAPMVLVLVGLVFPILLLLSALVFDLVFATWLAYRWWHGKHPHRPPHGRPLGISHW